MLLYPPTQTQPGHPIPDPTPPANYYSADHHLQIALKRYFATDPNGWQWADDLLRAWGATCAQQVEPLYAVAEKNGPVLHQFDRRGDRVDEIAFHPTYREIEKLAYGSGIAAMCNMDDFDGRGQP